MDDKVYSGCLALEAIFTAIQPYQLFQWISLIITIISAVVGLVFKIITWVNKSKADGKVDKEELKEGIDIISDGVKEISDAVKKAEDNLDENIDKK